MVVTELSAEVQRLTGVCNTLRANAACQIEELKACRADEVARLTAAIKVMRADCTTFGEENILLRDENDWLWRLRLSDVPEETVQQPEITSEAETKLDPRREKSRDRIAVGLAMRFCDFDPFFKRSGASKRAVDALADVGITITE